MRTQMKFTERVSVAAMFIQLGVLAVFVAACIFLFDSWREGIGVGAMLYILAAFISKRLVLKHHMEAMNLFRTGDYTGAVREFKKSYEFFDKHKIIDKLRYLLVMSSTGTSYRELAILGIGFCYDQGHQPEKAKEYYRRALEEYPNSKLAQSINESDKAEQQ